MRYQVRYAFFGACLGAGAPLGSLLWRALLPWPTHPFAALLQEWRSEAYFYNYMTVGTITAFVLFGVILGWRDEHLGRLAITDGLTGIFNHRHLQDILSQEIDRSNRYGTPVTVLMLDIDDFKQVNDTHGHPFGDFVLAKTARLIQNTLRRTDAVGRYGGEEFFVIMPQTNTEAALPIAERMGTVIRQCLFSAHGKEVNITVSIGLATYPSKEHGVKTKSGLLSAVDQALYRAKHLGKNRTVLWSDHF